jgi:hypothetical protein
MLFPLVVALVAVGLGVFLALGPREGAKGLTPIRLLALVASVVTIGTHLLPESFRELGALALLGFALGLVVPWGAQRAAGALYRLRKGEAAHVSHADVEIGYIGLVVHRFGDGLSMGAYGAAAHGEIGRMGVVLALSAHIVPVTTVMLLAVESAWGRRSALAHGAGLAAATMAGVATAGIVIDHLGRHGDDVLSPWVSAVVAGLLLHIVAHERPAPKAVNAP